MIEPTAEPNAPRGPDEHAAKVLELVYATIDEINQQLDAAHRLVKSGSTILIGEQGTLDSLTLINFLVTLEEACKERFGKSVKLLDEQLLGDANGPLHTVGSLTAHIAGRR